MLNQTRRESRDHATLSDIYTNNVIVRLAQIGEDVIRLFKKVSEINRPFLFTTTLLLSMHRMSKREDANTKQLALHFYLMGSLLCLGVTIKLK